MTTWLAELILIDIVPALLVDNERRSIITITKILREGNNEEVTVTAGSHFDGGWIWMDSTDTQNDIHAVTSFLKRMPTRLGKLHLFWCFMDSNQFLPWKEAIKSMPGSIVELDLLGNRLHVDDVIDVFDKVEEEVVVIDSLHDNRGKRAGRNPNKKERSKLQKALDRLNNKKLKIVVDCNYCDGDYYRDLIYITHKDSTDDG